jgi:hypothetical protein
MFSKVKITIITLMIVAFIAGPALSGQKYKPAPDPKYTKERGYGWSEEVPVDKPENKWNLLKEWRSDPNRYVFVDQTKDGQCNIVFEFNETGDVDEKGQKLYAFNSAVECEMMEAYIKMLLANKKKKGI